MTKIFEMPPLTLAIAAAIALAGLILVTAALPSVFFAPDVAAPSVPRIGAIKALDDRAERYGDYAVIFKQPVFNPGRVKDPVLPPASAALSIPSLSDFRLVGIVISTDTRMALVEQRSTNQVLTIRPGGVFAGRRVVNILESGVDLAGPSGSERLVVPKAESTHAVPHPPPVTLPHRP
jgi:hypothetical protein